MPSSNSNLRSDGVGSSSATVVVTPSSILPDNATLHLQAPEQTENEQSSGERSSRRVRWTEEVVDNEHMQKKKSKSKSHDIYDYYIIIKITN